MLAILSLTNMQDPTIQPSHTHSTSSFKRTLDGLASVKNIARIRIGLDHLATLPST
jgi:hypothetical protein